MLGLSNLQNGESNGKGKKQLRMKGKLGALRNYRDGI